MRLSTLRVDSHDGADASGAPPPQPKVYFASSRFFRRRILTRLRDGNQSDTSVAPTNAIALAAEAAMRRTLAFTRGEAGTKTRLL